MVTSISNLVAESRDYVVRNRAKALLALLATVLAYGFYVCTYTLNIDDIFTDFYNGGRLVAAGRFTGCLLQLFTGFLTYTPFFTMGLAVSLYLLAGLVYAMVLRDASCKRLSDNSAFVFWIVFVTYPIIAEQMVYPIIHLLALGYLCVAVSLYLLSSCLKERRVDYTSLALAIALMALCIDFYESFACVYITLMFGIVFVHNLYSQDEKPYRSLIVFIVCAMALLVAAVVARAIVAKVFMYFWHGTLKSGYSGNSSLYWFEIGVFDCVFWLVRTLFLRYFWAGIDYLAIFVFVACVLLGLLLSALLSFRRKSLLPFACFILMTGAALSLNILLGLAVKYTMAQALTPFVAFTVMLAFSMTERCRWGRNCAVAIICILVLNQIKSLNTWSVVNYKRSEYELHVIDNIGLALSSAYPIDRKPVVFVGAADAPHLPKSLMDYYETGQPLAKLFQKSVLRLTDACMPKKYYRNIGDFFHKDIKDASGLLELCKEGRCGSSSFHSYIAWSRKYPSWYGKYIEERPGGHIYGLFRDRGYDLKECSIEQFDKFKDSYKGKIAYPCNGYITEEDDCIVVNFGE